MDQTTNYEKETLFLRINKSSVLEVALFMIVQGEMTSI